MVIPVYGTAAYKGLSFSFLFMAWIISQGIGLADRGVNAIVDYLAAGGTIYQVAQTAKDTASEQDIVKPALDVLAAETCVWRLRQAAKNTEAAAQAVDEQLKASGVTPPARRAPQTSDVGYFFDPTHGKAQFGTKNKDPNDKTQPYFSECGTVTWSIDPNNTQKNFALSTAMLQMITDLDTTAANVARNYPVVCAPNTVCNTSTSVLDNQVQLAITNSIFNYANLVAPLRVSTADAATQQAYQTLQSIKTRGWLVLGAYYPIMGNLNQNNKQSLKDFSPNTVLGTLTSGQANNSTQSVYDFSKLSSDDSSALKSEFTYVASQENSTKTLIGYLEAGQGNTLQEQLAMPDQQGPFQGKWDINNPSAAGQQAGSTAGNIVSSGASLADRIEALKNMGIAAGSYTAYGVSQVTNPIINFFGAGGEANNTGTTLGGLLDHGKLVKSAALVGVASAAGGPMAWVSVPPALGIFVAIVDKFRDALDQTQNADPLLALQDFGFYVMDQAMIFLGILLGGSFIASLLLSWIPSVNAVGAFSSTANFLSPIIAIFFAALAAAGFGFGVYIPMIPLIVWISAILGWLGHSFQAIIGAPLVALRMTTAEGEGLLGGATDGVMMLLGVLLTPFLLVVGFSVNLILLKQVLIVVNYLFSLFASFTFVPKSDSFAWIVIGVPAILLVYFSLLTTVVQSLSTKLIGEFPGEVLRHLHTAMTGHRAAEQVMGRLEQATEKGAGHAGELGGRGVNLQPNKQNDQIISKPQSQPKPKP